MCLLSGYDLKTACILELKRTHSLDDCQQAADDAVEQIKRKDYAIRYCRKGYRQVYGLGIGFAKTSCEIVSLGNLAAEPSTGTPNYKNPQA